MTCTELVGHIQTVLGIGVSKSLVLNVVHSLGYTFKRVKKRCVPGNAGAHAVNTERFLEQYRLHQRQRTLMVSVDESGFDHRARPFYGFAPRGKAAVVQYKACGDRKRYNLLMAVSNAGRRAHQIHAGTVNAKVFAGFVSDMPFPPGSVLLLDNAAIHKSPIVREAIGAKGFVPLFLPAYSPQFQPIELVFGRLKLAYYKQRLQQNCEQRAIASSVDSLVQRLCDAGIIQRCFKHVDGVIADNIKTSEISLA